MKSSKYRMLLILKKITFLYLFLSFSFPLMGCDSAYESLIGESAAIETVESIHKPSTFSYSNAKDYLMALSLKVSDAFKLPAMILLPISIAIGVLLLNIFHNTAAIRRSAWFLFIIGIPLILLLLGWGSAILYTILYQSK